MLGNMTEWMRKKVVASMTGPRKFVFDEKV